MKFPSNIINAYSDGVVGYLKTSSGRTIIVSIEEVEAWLKKNKA